MLKVLLYFFGRFGGTPQLLLYFLATVAALLSYFYMFWSIQNTGNSRSQKLKNAALLALLVLFYITVLLRRQETRSNRGPTLKNDGLLACPWIPCIIVSVSTRDRDQQRPKLKNAGLLSLPWLLVYYCISNQRKGPPDQHFSFLALCWALYLLRLLIQ